MFLLEFLHSVRGWLRWAGWTLRVLLKIPSFSQTCLFLLPFSSVQWDCGPGHSRVKVKCSRRILMGLLSGTRSLREPLSFFLLLTLPGQLFWIVAPLPLVQSHLNTKLTASQQFGESSLSNSRVRGIKGGSLECSATLLTGPKSIWDLEIWSRWGRAMI